jgi:hypothetical protein
MEICTKKDITLPLLITSDGTYLESVTSARILGVYFSVDLKWSAHKRASPPQTGSTTGAEKKQLSRRLVLENLSCLDQDYLDLLLPDLVQRLKDGHPTNTLSSVFAWQPPFANALNIAEGNI